MKYFKAEDVMFSFFSTVGWFTGRYGFSNLNAFWGWIACISAISIGIFFGEFIFQKFYKKG